MSRRFFFICLLVILSCQNKKVPPLYQEDLNLIREGFNLMSRDIRKQGCTKIKFKNREFRYQKKEHLYHIKIQPYEQILQIEGILLGKKGCGIELQGIEVEETSETFSPLERFLKSDEERLMGTYYREHRKSIDFLIYRYYQSLPVSWGWGEKKSRNYVERRMEVYRQMSPLDRVKFFKKLLKEGKMKLSEEFLESLDPREERLGKKVAVIFDLHKPDKKVIKRRITRVIWEEE